jgi:salicylate hydroxylase
VSAPVLIAGGGIAGLAAALALAQKGQASCVYERADTFSELGAGVQLGPNALWVLQQWGLLPALEALACRPEVLHIRAAASGKRISRMRLGQAVQQRYGLPYLTIHRAHLHQILLQAAQSHALISLHSKTSVQGYKTHEGGVELIFAHGQPVCGSAVLACDGVWSRLAPQVQPALRPAIYSGQMAYRAMLPMAQALKLLPHIRHEVGLWLGRGAHVVHYPVDGGQQLNLVVLLHAPHAGSEQGWHSPIPQGELQTELERTLGCSQACALQDLLWGADNWSAWPLHGRKPQGGWARGRAAILGDAAHPMLPYLAQGAAMALEDAWVLAQHWQGQDVAASLQRYAAQRQGRCTRVVNAAARNAQIFHASGVMAMGRDAYLRLQSGRVVGMPWLYGWRGA